MNDMNGASKEAEGRASLVLKGVILGTIGVLFIAASLGLCLCSVRAADYGSYANICDMDDVDCAALADDQYLRYDAATDTWIPEAIDLSPYALLDGTNGPTTGEWSFGANVGIGNPDPSVGLHLGSGASTHSLTGSTDMIVSGKSEFNNSVYLDANVYTDRWLNNESNTFLGVNVAGDGNLSSSGGGPNGSANTALGNSALRAVTTGYANMAIGTLALRNVTTSVQNVGIGYRAGFGLVDGAADNIFLGSYAGGQASTHLQRNVGIGYQALYSLSDSDGTSGGDNVGIGAWSLMNLGVSRRNVGIGTLAGRYQANGSTALTDAENSVYIGYNAMGKDNSDSNSIVIGSEAAGQGANTVVLGNDSITDTYLQGTVHAAIDRLTTVDGSPSTLMLTDNTTDMTLTGSDGDLIFDQTSGDFEFRDVVRGPSSGCTAATTLTIDSGAVKFGGVNYDADIFPACASGHLAIGSNEDLSTPLPLCQEGPAIDFTVIPSFTFATDDIRACAFDVEDLAGPGAFITVLLPSWISCATWSGNVLDGRAADADDQDWFAYDAGTCTYVYSPDAGMALADGWPSPPTVTTDATPGHYWSITDAGDMTLDGHMAIGTAINPQSVVYVEKSWTNPGVIGGDLSRVLGFQGNGTCELGETCGEAGIQGSVVLYGAGTWDVAYGVAATAASHQTSTGPSSYINAIWGALGHYGSGTMSYSSGAYLEYFLGGNGDLDDSQVIKIESPSISATGSGVANNPAGIYIADQSCDHNACDVGRVNGAIGIHVEAFSDPENDWGIKNLSPSYFGSDRVYAPDLPAETGTTLPLCVDENGRIYVGTCG